MLMCLSPMSVTLATNLDSSVTSFAGCQIPAVHSSVQTHVVCVEEELYRSYRANMCHLYSFNVSLQMDVSQYKLSSYDSWQTL